MSILAFLSLMSMTLFFKKAPMVTLLWRDLDVILVWTSHRETEQSLLCVVKKLLLSNYFHEKVKKIKMKIEINFGAVNYM